MIDDKTFNQVSQFAHFGCAAALVLAGAAFGHVWIAAIAMLVWAVMKEFWYDEKYETPEVRGSGLEDFLFYAIGIVTAVLVWSLAGRL
jgi:hypothetical protein